MKRLWLTCVTVTLLIVLSSLALGTTPTYAVEPSADPTPAAAPTTDPPTDGSSSPISILPDPKVWAAEVFTTVVTGMFGALALPLRLGVAGALDGSLSFVFQTPPSGSYASSPVQGLWGIVRLIANAALVLVALFAGYSVIASEHLGSPYHDALEVLPRLVLGALLVNTSLTWTGLAIDANNALCQAVGGATLPAWDQVNVGSQVLAEAIATLVYYVASLLFVLQMLMRLALVDVLLVVSPIALLCWVLPQTQNWARLWTHTFFAAVFTQFVQVLALKLGSALLGDASIVGTSAVLLKILLGVAVIVLTLRIPGLLRLHLGSGLGFVRYYAVITGARALGLGGRSAGQAGGSGARAGATGKAGT